jgi:RNA polymerase sigma factor (sigma-70 family)
MLGRHPYWESKLHMIADDDERSLSGIVAALRGSAAEKRWAFDQLYEKYAGRVKRYMTRSVTLHEAEELMQEVFIRVLRRGDTFREKANRFEAWFWTIARNLLIDTVAAKRRIDQRTVGEQLDTDELMDTRTDPEREARDREIQDCFQRGYEQYRTQFPERAAVLAWLVIDQMSIEEIADILGRTRGATRQYLFECRTRLKPFLEPCRALLDV